MQINHIIIITTTFIKVIPMRNSFDTKRGSQFSWHWAKIIFKGGQQKDRSCGVVEVK